MVKLLDLLPLMLWGPSVMLYMLGAGSNTHASIGLPSGERPGSCMLTGGAKDSQCLLIVHQLLSETIIDKPRREQHKAASMRVANAHPG